jgi:hypothetical protein
LDEVKEKSQMPSKRQSMLSKVSDKKVIASRSNRPSKLDLSEANKPEVVVRKPISRSNSYLNKADHPVNTTKAAGSKTPRKVPILDRGERKITVTSKLAGSSSKEKLERKNLNKSQTDESGEHKVQKGRLSQLRRAQTTDVGHLTSKLENIKKGSLIENKLLKEPTIKQVVGPQENNTQSNPDGQMKSARDVASSMRDIQDLPSIKEREDSAEEQGSPTSPGRHPQFSSRSQSHVNLQGASRTALLRKSPTLEFDHLHQHLATTLKQSLDFEDIQKTKNTFVMLLENLTFEMNRAVIYSQLLEKAEDTLREKQSLLEAVERAHADCDEKIHRMVKQLGEFKEDRDKLMAELKARTADDGEDMIKDNRLELKTVKPKDKKKNTQLLKEKSQINELVQLFGKRDLKYAHQNHAKELVNVLSKGSFTQFKNPMPLKALLKTITTIYTDKIKDARKLTDTKKQDFDEYVYDYYMQVFGIKEIGEKKFCYFVLSLKYHGQFFRVNLFSRFMGILQGVRYNQEQISKYLEGLEFLETNSKGYPIKNTDTSVRMLYPFVRAEEFTRFVFEKKLPPQVMSELKKKIDSLKEDDRSGMNTGIVDADVFLEQIIEKYGAILNRTKQYVVEAFDSCDLDGNKTCSVNEWVLLCRYIEPKSFNLNNCIQLFFENANKQIKGESCMTFDKFAAVCTDNSLFSEENQNKFLGLEEGSNVEDLFSRIRANWSSKLEELHTILDSLTFLADEEIERWKENLEVLNLLFQKKHIASTMKSTTIAYFLTLKELTRLQAEDNASIEEDSEGSETSQQWGF